MPQVQVAVYLGPDDVVWTALEPIPDWLIEWAEESMSEFEVLEMSLHDEHYARGTMRHLHATPVVVPTFLDRPELKSVAPNVVGNIGEGLGLAVLLSLSKLFPFEITRVKRRKDVQLPEAKRTPDYVASLAPPRSSELLIRGLLEKNAHRFFLQQLALTKLFVAFPRRFPIEAKGTMKSSRPALWSGIWQLVEYWYSCVESGEAMDEVGYGIVLYATDIGDVNRSVSIHVFAPRDQAAMIASLDNLVDNRGGRRAFNRQFEAMGGAAFVGTTLA